MRKHTYSILTGCYSREQTQMAFAGWAKAFAARADSSVSGQGTGSDIATDVDGFFEARQEAFCR